MSCLSSQDLNVELVNSDERETETLIIYSNETKPCMCLWSPLSLSNLSCQKHCFHLGLRRVTCFYIKPEKSLNNSEDGQNQKLQKHTSSLGHDFLCTNKTFISRGCLMSRDCHWFFVHDILVDLSGLFHSLFLFTIFSNLTV